MSAQKTLVKLISGVVTEIAGDILIDIQVTVPSHADFGDFSTNIALQLTKQLNRPPREIATDIISRMQLRMVEEKSYGDLIQSLSVAGAGFINITLKNDYLFDAILHFDKNIEGVKAEKSERIMIEYGQPNTHKLPHIGHIFSYIVGDSISRILETVGHTVKRANYQGDVGPHVAKAIYSWIQKGRPIPEALVEKVKLMQECYQEGSAAYLDNDVAKNAIDKINVQIYKNDPDIMEDWETTRKWCLDFYKTLEADLGVKQDVHYLESQVWEDGKALVEKNMGTIFEESDQAIVFKGETYGLHTRVFLTKKGTPTYEAKDIGLNIRKYKEWKFDRSIITTASEQNAYFKVVMKALELINPELEGKLFHIGFGMVSLSTGKMSSRSGNILSGIDLIQEVKERVAEVINEREDLSKDEKEIIVQEVAMGAIKFAFLKNNILQNMKFDLQESVAFDGKSGPYLQYTFARIQSILNQKSKALEVVTGEELAKILVEKEERALAAAILRYPLAIQNAANMLAPHTLSEYLYDLAQTFNSFYGVHQVNNAATPELTNARRTLISLTAEIIGHGLNLLGIKPINKM